MGAFVSLWIPAFAGMTGDRGREWLGWKAGMARLTARKLSAFGLMSTRPNN